MGLVGIIVAQERELRNQSLDGFCRSVNTGELIEECRALDRFRKTSDNLYERVRALFFLYAIHRFYLPYKPGMKGAGLIPFAASSNILKRRFDEAIDILLHLQAANGPNAALSSALAASYYGLAFQALAEQVRRSVRSVRGSVGSLALRASRRKRIRSSA